jgi:hypothetical protein
MLDNAGHLSRRDTKGEVPEALALALGGHGPCRQSMPQLNLRSSDTWVVLPQNQWYITICSVYHGISMYIKVIYGDIQNLWYINVYIYIYHHLQ